MPGAARGDSTTPYEPQWGPARGLKVSDSVHMCKLGVLLHVMREDNASCDDLSVSASQALCLYNRIVAIIYDARAATNMDNR